MLVSMSRAPRFLKLPSPPLILSNPLGAGPRNSFTRDSEVTPSNLGWGEIEITVIDVM